MEKSAQSVAYFCLEYALEDKLPIYAGGLGILAGDLVLETGKGEQPFVFLGLFYRCGFPAYGCDKPEITPLLDPNSAGFDTLKDANGRDLLVDCLIGSCKIYVKVWHKQYGSSHVYLLDTDVFENSPPDRTITQFLYGPNDEVMLKQQLILGICGVRLLEKLNINPQIYHLNEGHCSFAILELALTHKRKNQNQSFYDSINAIKKNVVASKHTILSGAGLHLSFDQLQQYLDFYLKKEGISYNEFFSCGIHSATPQSFSTTKFLLNFAKHAHAVSKIHADFEKQVHPNSKLFGITNGVSWDRWLAQNWKQKNLSTLSDEEIWDCHTYLRNKLVQFVANRTGTELDNRALTIVWARRFTGYKRPELLFTDLARLDKLTNNHLEPVQIVFAGLASAADSSGHEMICLLQNQIKNFQLNKHIVYLPDYDLEAAKILVAGADLWLNTPQRGKEACGTSGMKSGLNGVLQMSISDGWYPEIDWKDIGWIITDEQTSDHIYYNLETEVVTSFYKRVNGLPLSWIAKMRKTMEITREKFTTKRLLKDYNEQLYC